MRKLREKPDQTARRPAVNHILSALPDGARRNPIFERIALPLGEVLHRRGERVERVYFPVRGIVSTVQRVGGNENLGIEIAVTGSEGAVGAAAIFGVAEAAADALVQTAGEALAVSVADLEEPRLQSRVFTNRLFRFTNFLLAQASVAVFCSRYHTVEQRLARWLLAIQDRVGGGELHLTQSFMSNMTGTSRSTATETVGNLAGNGLIEPRYGRIFIADRRGLEAAACECYRSIKRQYDDYLAG